MRGFLKMLLVLALLGGGGYLLARTVMAPRPITVTVQAVERGPVEATVSNSTAGTVMVRYRTMVAVETPGRVVAIIFREGARVEEGDVLLRLDDREAQARVTLAEQDLAASRAALEERDRRLALTRSKLDRAERLHGQGLVPEEDMDEARSAFDVAVAAQKAAVAAVSRGEAAVKVARVELEKSVVTAPISGVVAEVVTEVGAWLVPGGPAVELLVPDDLYIRAEIDEVDAGRLAVDLPVRVTLDPWPDRTLAGRVSRIASYVSDQEAQNRTLEIEVILTQPTDGLELRPGFSADVEVILERKPDTLRIPTFALLPDNHVLVVQGDRAVSRAIEVGISNWDHTEVSAGLRAGELVITSLDREEVKDGALVTVRGRPAAPPPPPAESRD